jgi:isopenicillin-N N-acyltransferase-like protein
MGAIRLLELRGAPGERGYQHGQALRDEIGAFWERWIAQVCAPPGGPGATAEEVISFGLANVPASKGYAPDLVEEVDGIAQGAGLSFEKVFLLNCFDEVGCHGPGRYGAAAHHCTAFAATGRATRDGTTYVGQGWDTGPSDGAWYMPIILRLVRPGGEPEALVFTHPGMVGGTGINTSGLALVWNTTSPTDARPGVPATFVVRKALQQPSLAPLVGAVIACPRAGGLNFIVGAPFGAVDIEVTATRYAVTYSSTILHHANHYEAPELKPFEKDIPLRTPDTLIRTGRMRQILEGGPARPVSLRGLRHDAGPGARSRLIARGPACRRRVAMSVPADDAGHGGNDRSKSASLLSPWRGE